MEGMNQILAKQVELSIWGTRGLISSLDIMTLGELKASYNLGMDRS